MIVWRISKLKFETNRNIGEGTYIELQNIFGKKIYRIEKKGNHIHMNNPDNKTGFSFMGNWEYLRIFRHKDPLMDSFKVELFCPNCVDKIYKLSAKLPLLIKIKTDFHVTKDTH